MTRIYLIRHCEAEGNLYRRIHGSTDSQITPKGRRQIAALAERFRDVSVDALYASDLRRTQETAGAILQYHALPLHIEPRLREMSTGVWEDRPFGDVGFEDPELLRRFNNDPVAWGVEGSEAYAALQQRMRSVVEEIAARHRGRTVVCVSHGMAIRSLLALYLGLPSAEINSVPHGDNTAVSLLEYGDDWSVQMPLMNDASHLTEELSTFARQSWWRQPDRRDPDNIHFRRLNPLLSPGTYTEYYAKTWKAVHGSTGGFQPQLYIAAAISHAAVCPDAIVTIHRPNGECVGITELDTVRGRSQGYGWICLCYVEPAYRRRLLGIQLIGHAVSVFRKLGRSSLRLCVYEGNDCARRFYESAEFRVVGETEGVKGKLLIMEKAL